jgi:hypothetical protein
MRQLILSLLILAIFAGCRKNNEPDTVIVDLSIISATTPATAVQGQDIISQVRCSGSDLCYQFSNFEIKEMAARHFMIMAKGTYPNSKKGDIVCPQAIYYADTSLTIHTPAKGQYILNFFNHSLLIKSDTVQVN